LIIYENLLAEKTNYGELFIVATPIGNLGDISFRAIEILKTADIIYYEDTRVTSNLLKHYNVQTALKPMNARMEEKVIATVIAKLINGLNIALVSDAGTPTISDPGIRLVSEAIKNGVKVTGIPGANAAILALSISGLPTNSFIFEGFLPQKKGRQKLLKELAEERRTIVLYESTYRIEKLLKELENYMPDRLVVVCRELTKKFEESWRGYPTGILNNFELKTTKGEFVVIIAPINWK